MQTIPVVWLRRLPPQRTASLINALTENPLLRTSSLRVDDPRRVLTLTLAAFLPTESPVYQRIQRETTTGNAIASISMQRRTFEWYNAQYRKHCSVLLSNANALYTVYVSSSISNNRIPTPTSERTYREHQEKWRADPARVVRNERRQRAYTAHESGERIRLSHTVSAFGG
jgi:hypothetical protein